MEPMNNFIGYTKRRWREPRLNDERDNSDVAIGG
jgi:hypothetical protein